MSGDAVQIPDDQAFIQFKNECNSEEGWNLNHNKSGVTVWIQILEEEKSLHKIKQEHVGHGWLHDVGMLWGSVEVAMGERELARSSYASPADHGLHRQPESP